jgi:hypothetical protein
VLVAKLTIFDGNPCVPVMVMYHDKKFQEMHEEFFTEVKKVTKNSKSYFLKNNHFSSQNFFDHQRASKM